MIMIPPKICKMSGISLNKNIAIIDATTGSQSFDAETNDGEKYLRHHEKILCPIMVENSANNIPTTAAEYP